MCPMNKHSSSHRSHFNRHPFAVKKILRCESLSMTFGNLFKTTTTTTSKDHHLSCVCDRYKISIRLDSCVCARTVDHADCYSSSWSIFAWRWRSASTREKNVRCFLNKCVKRPVFLFTSLIVDRLGVTISNAFTITLEKHLFVILIKRNFPHPLSWHFASIRPSKYPKRSTIDSGWTWPNGCRDWTDWPDRIWPIDRPRLVRNDRAFGKATCRSASTTLR